MSDCGDALLGCCPVCGEFDCDANHDDSDDDDDGSWLFDGSGMVGDD